MASREESDQQGVGTEPVDLGQSRYDFRYLVFPNDLGMEDNSHYMIININVPTKTFKSSVAAGRYAGSQFTPLGATDVSKVDKLRYGPSGSLSNAPVVIGGGNNGDRPAFSIPRRTKRIAESVVLHMPTPLVYNSQNAYEEISLSALAGRVGTAALGGASAFATALRGAFQNAIQRGAAARAISNPLSPQGALSTASKVLQSPINPAVEVLFANTLVRQFTFEVLMAPRNETESLSMHKIIKTLRFHAAPEISDAKLGDIPGLSGVLDALGTVTGTNLNDVGPGLFWIPPAEFDITFFHKGEENTNILRINTCVLERIEVDYAPTGVYSTFRNGHPVAARLSMGFREVEPVHKKRVLQGF